MFGRSWELSIFSGNRVVRIYGSSNHKPELVCTILLEVVDPDFSVAVWKVDEIIVVLCAIEKRRFVTSRLPASTEYCPMPLRI